MSEHPRAPGPALAFLFWLAAAAALPLPAAPLSVQLTTAEKQQLQREARLVVDLLQNHHYSGRAFREIDNREMIGRFLYELDPGADFLTTDDLAFIHGRFDRTLKSVYVFRGDLQPAFEIFDLFAERARDRLKWVEQRLTRDFDLTVDETYHNPREAQAAAAGLPADQRWEQRLKDQVLTEILLGRTPDEARVKVDESYAEMRRWISAIDSLGVRERFFDSIIRSFDPHSGYFSADSAREFEVDMENAVVGLGLDLRKEEGRCVVAAVQPGGPADLHSTIAPGDTIVALAEADGPWFDAARKRLNEIVGLVRGEPGGKLRLAYQPQGTTERREVTLERTRVVLAADRAHGAVSAVPDSSGRIRRIGSIVLPSFYAGGEGANATSAAKDTRELLDQMLAQKIEGLVLDLRTNPGGALAEAVALSQLFLPRGSVMLSRGLSGNLQEHAIKEAPPVYAGPLVVLTSEQSASASEVFAGAMKYYRRAVIVGGETSFGKGTVQAYIALAKLPGIDAKGTKDWGTLRLTAQRFYLPDGGAVQWKGVPAQIVLPDFTVPGWEREAKLPHALPEESISPPTVPPRTAADQTATPDALLQRLGDRAARDFKELPEWDLWRQEQAHHRARFEQESRSLLLATRQKEWAGWLEKYQGMQRTRRTLNAAGAFATQPLEIAAVTATHAAHEARLRSPAENDGAPLLHRLRRGVFFVETDQGRLREVRLHTLAVTAYYGDTAALAAAFSDQAGRPITEAEARRILEVLPRHEHKTDADLLGAINQATGGKLAEPAVRAGLEAFLQRLTTLDGEMCRERPGLDIPLRESQRLAAAWAESPAGLRAP